MAFELSENSKEFPGIIPLKLPGGITLESLYQLSNQSIWFLIWILKKNRFWSDLTREVLEAPFTVRRYYLSNRQKHFIEMTKNKQYYSIYRGWYKDGQLRWEEYWKDGNRNGIMREWYIDGKLKHESHWKDGHIKGISREWCIDGQLIHKLH